MKALILALYLPFADTGTGTEASKKTKVNTDAGISIHNYKHPHKAHIAKKTQKHLSSPVSGKLTETASHYKMVGNVAPQKKIALSVDSDKELSPVHNTQHYKSQHHHKAN